LKIPRGYSFSCSKPPVFVALLDQLIQRLELLRQGLLQLRGAGHVGHRVRACGAGMAWSEQWWVSWDLTMKNGGFMGFNMI